MREGCWSSFGASLPRDSRTIRTAATSGEDLLHALRPAEEEAPFQENGPTQSFSNSIPILQSSIGSKASKKNRTSSLRGDRMVRTFGRTPECHGKNPAAGLLETADRTI